MVKHLKLTSIWARLLGTIMTLFWLASSSFFCGCGNAASGENKRQVGEKGTISSPYVVVLGIAQDAGYPQAGCKKDCCKEAWGNPEKQRLVSCIAVVDPKEGTAWMVDATPDFPEQLKTIESIGKDKTIKLAGIFLTHAHIGHYTGLMHLGREVIGANATPVFAMPKMRAFLENNGPWSQLVDLKNIDLRNLSSDSTVILNERIKITPLSVPHRDEFSETVGYKLEGLQKSLLFIPDIDKWHVWERNVVEEVGKVDYALLDGSFFQNGEIPGRDMSEIPHPFVMESMAAFEGQTADEKAKIHFIHFNHTNPVMLENSEARKSVQENGFRICEEGDVFEL